MQKKDLSAPVHFLVWLLWIKWLSHFLEGGLVAWNYSYKECKFARVCIAFFFWYSKSLSLGWARVYYIFIKAKGYSVQCCDWFLPSIFIKGDYPWHRYREDQGRKEQSYRRAFLFIPVKWSQRKGKICPRNIIDIQEEKLALN